MEQMWSKNSERRPLASVSTSDARECGSAEDGMQLHWLNVYFNGVCLLVERLHRHKGIFSAHVDCDEQGWVDERQIAESCSQSKIIVGHNPAWMGGSPLHRMHHSPLTHGRCVALPAVCRAG